MCVLTNRDVYVCVCSLIEMAVVDVLNANTPAKSSLARMVMSTEVGVASWRLEFKSDIVKTNDSLSSGTTSLLTRRVTLNSRTPGRKSARPRPPAICPDLPERSYLTSSLVRSPLVRMTLITALSLRSSLRKKGPAVDGEIENIPAGLSLARMVTTAVAYKNTHTYIHTLCDDLQYIMTH